MEHATHFEPRSPYFDAPLSPPLFFPNDAEHEVDPFPFPFDDQRLSSPDLLTPSSNTDSNESIDFTPNFAPDASYVADEQLTQPRSDSAAYHATLISPPSPLAYADALVPTTSSTPSSSSSSSFSASLESTSLTLNMYSHPPRPTPTGPIELIFPLPPVAKPKRNRTNLSHLSNNERLQHKRARHRQIDATRREREKAAIRRLRLLVEEMTGGGEKGTGAAAAEEEENEREKDEDGENALGNKTDVLESGITLIEQLRDLCSTLQQDSGKPAPVAFTRWPQKATFTTPPGCPTMLHLLPSPTSSIIAHLDRSHTLRASTTVSSPICSVMVLFPGAVVMDVSRSFIDFTGYSDSQLVHSHMNPWYLPPSSKHHTICPLLVDGRDEHTGKVTKLVGQYGTSKGDMGKLIRGEKGRLDLDWRYRVADGRLIETKTTGWMEDQDRNEEVSVEFTDEAGEKRTWTSYRTLIRLVFARQDAVEIDDGETRSFKPPTWQTTEVRSGRRTQIYVRPVES